MRERETKTDGRKKRLKTKTNRQTERERRMTGTDRQVWFYNWLCAPVVKHFSADPESVLQSLCEFVQTAGDILL